MVGRALVQHCESLGDEVLGCDHGALDISDSEAVMQVTLAKRPDAVINCAAWTDVDGCETNHDRAYAANATGPENLAKASANVGARFVTVSTDYVFDGEKDGFYVQTDIPNPISVYGRSKLAGEVRAQAAHPEGTSVVRTGFVFGLVGQTS
jgi:dTDP-4-dehydrorhamnose reductase